MNRLVSIAFVLVSLLLASPGCQRDPAALLERAELSAVPPAPPPSPPAPSVAAVVMAADSLKWQRRKLAQTGVSLEFFAGDEVSEALWPGGGGTLYQAHRIEEAGVVRLSIRAEAEEGLEAFRGDHGQWTFTPPAAATACGKPAEVQRATHDAQHIACVITPEGNHPAYVPPRAAMAVVFEHRGRPVRVTWEAESEALATLEAVKEHFFASVRCD